MGRRASVAATTFGWLVTAACSAGVVAWWRALKRELRP